jgi:predicted nucleotidyltransferase
MNRLLSIQFEVKRSAIAALCEKYDVTSLDLFGSATTDEWKPAESDLDFLVVFRRDAGRGIADRYLGLAEDLESLFGRPVDLITPASIRNPYFRQRVETTRSRIYVK